MDTDEANKLHAIFMNTRPDYVRILKRYHGTESPVIPALLDAFVIIEQLEFGRMAERVQRMAIKVN